MDLNVFPGGDLVQEEMADLARGIESIPALHDKLAESDPDSVHSRYNALVRRLVSFENAAECAGLGAPQ
jgi:hypothetical protein